MSPMARLLFFIALVVMMDRAAAADNLISIDSLSTISEDFNGMGSANTAPLPQGWLFSASSSFAGSFQSQYSAGTTGFGAITATSHSGYYNFADGVNATSTDRAAGFLIDINFPPDKSLMVDLKNNSGATITSVNLSYDVEKYRSGLASAEIKLWYGFDGATWTSIPGATVDFNSDTNNNAVDPAISVNRSLALSSLNIANQTNLFFRWHYHSNTLSNGQGLGIDNFSLSFNGTPPPQTLTWAGPIGGNWDDVSANWRNAASNNIPWNDARRDRALFAAPSAGVSTNVNISAPRAAGGITFNGGAASYIISGASLTLFDNASIEAMTSASVISAPLILQGDASLDVAGGASLEISGSLTTVAGKTLRKRGPGILRLSGPRNFAASTILDAGGGTVRLGSNAAASNLRIDIQSTTPGTDSLVVADIDQDLAALNIMGASGKQGFDLNSPTQSGGFRSIRIHASDLAEAKTIVNASIRNASANPGDGIFDSGLAAHENSALGIAIVNDYVLIRPTRIGDVNLDGIVTIADFIDLSANFNHTGVTWQEGDMNGDGSVTIADFIDLSANFNGSYSGEILPISSADRETLGLFAAEHGAAVPEATSAWMVFLASLAIAGRRRVQSAK